MAKPCTYLLGRAGASQSEPLPSGADSDFVYMFIYVYTSIKTFPKNALRCRDDYAKNHSNKVWMALC